MANIPTATVFVEARLDPKSLATIQTQLRTALAGGGPSSTVFQTQTRGAATLAASQGTLSKATKAATRSLHEQADVIEANSSQLNRFSRGVASTGLSMFGLRGATLAATSGFLAGAAAITAIGKAVGIATGFNSQIAVFGAVTGATATELERVEAVSKKLGASLALPGVTASDAAEAMTELAKAGLNVSDAIDATVGTLQLGIAANIGYAQAVELVASALNAFDLAGSRASVVADTLANAANAAQGSIVDIGIAFQQAAAIGHQVGLTFQDTTLFLTELAKAGLTGSDAGTSLRTALIRLINPSKKAQEIFDKLGIAVRDAEGNLRPEFFTNLGAAVAGMTKKQRDATLAIIGGQDAVRALSILSRVSTEDLLRLRNELAQEGTAAKVAEARMIGLAGAGQGLSNAVETIALSLGQKATPALTSFTVAITNTVQAVAASPLVTGTLGDAAHVTADAFRFLGDTIRTIAPVLGVVATGLSKAVGAIGIGQIVAAVVAFKALRAVMASLAGGALVGLAGRFSTLARFIALLGVQMRFAATSAVGFRAVQLSLAPLLANLIRPAGILTVALAGLAAGFFYLATRESNVEAAERRLKETTEKLADALGRAAVASDDLARSQGLIDTDRLAVETAQLAAAEAQRALAQSAAAEGSFERLQLENRVRVALNDVALAEQQLAADRAAQKEATDEANAASSERQKLIQEEAQRIRDLIAANSVLATELAAQARTPRALSPRIGQEDVGRAQRQSIEATIRALREQAAVEQASTDASLRDIGQRKAALADIAERLRDLPDQTISLILNARNVTQGLIQVRENFFATGRIGAANFTDGIIRNLNFTPINNYVQSAMAAIEAEFAVGGSRSGAAFTANLLPAVQAGINGVLNLVASAIANIAAGLRVAALEAEVAGKPGAQGQALSAEEAALRAKLAITKGRQAREDLLNEIKSVMGQRASLAAAGASAAKAAGSAEDKLQKALDEADQKFLAELQLARGALDIKFLRSERTKSLQDDIADQRTLQAFLKRKIAEAKKSIHDALLLAQTVQQLTQALGEARNRELQLEEQRRENRRSRIIEKRDRIQESLDLNIQIAETQGNKGKELRAHQALLNFLIQRRKHTNAGTLEYRRLTLAIEQEKKAIRDLKKAQKDKNDGLKQLEFEFLQQQQGFAANLLGNLLPRGSTAGTVGGGSITTPTTPTTGAPGDEPFGNFTPRRDLGVGVFAAQKMGGGPQQVSAGQMNTLITIARAQLAVLRGASPSTPHPEAREAWKYSATAMLNTGWG